MSFATQAAPEARFGATEFIQPTGTDSTFALYESVFAGG